MSYIDDKAVIEESENSSGFWKGFLKGIIFIKMILLVWAIYLAIDFLWTIL